MSEFLMLRGIFTVVVIAFSGCSVSSHHFRGIPGYSDEESAPRLLTYLKYFEELKITAAALPVSEREFVFLVDESDEFVQELIRKSAFRFARSIRTSPKTLLRYDGSAPQLGVEIRETGAERRVLDLHARSQIGDSAIYRAVFVRVAKGWKLVDWRLIGIT